MRCHQPNYGQNGHLIASFVICVVSLKAMSKLTLSNPLQIFIQAYRIWYISADVIYQNIHGL